MKQDGIKRASIIDLSSQVVMIGLHIFLLQPCMHIGILLPSLILSLFSSYFSPLYIFLSNKNKNPGNVLFIHFRDEQTKLTRGATQIDTIKRIRFWFLNFIYMKCSQTYYSSEMRFQSMTHYPYQTFHKSRVFTYILYTKIKICQ